MAQLGETAVEDKCFSTWPAKGQPLPGRGWFERPMASVYLDCTKAGNIKSATSDALESKRGPVVVNRDLANGVQAIERCRRPNDVTAEITASPDVSLG